METGDYVLDLARIHVELEDETLTSKLLTACLFALSAMQGYPPGQMLVHLSEHVPSKSDWEDEYLPQLVDFPDDYDSIEG